MKTGFVVSDMHIFSPLSHAERYLPAIHAAARDADFFVFNGDTFYFRWSALPSVAATVDEAIHWLRDLTRRFPACEFHLVLGNHDYDVRFRAALDELAAETTNLLCSEFYLRLGSAFFLHGDAANRRMDVVTLVRSRSRWRNGRKKAAWIRDVYGALQTVGVVQAVQRVWFPRKRVVRRISHYLQSVAPEVRDGVHDVYFGHTHRSFSNHVYSQLRFHNTGSAVRGSPFEMRRIETT